MKIKEFEAKTLKECLNQVRQEMGPDAVILDTKKSRKGGFLGLGKREAVSITAATGITISEQAPRSEKLVPTPGISIPASPELTIPPQIIKPENAPAAPTLVADPTAEKSTNDKLDRLEKEMSELKQGIQSICIAVNTTSTSLNSTRALPKSEFPELLMRLTQADIPEELALELLSELPDLNSWGQQARTPLAESALRDIMLRRLTCSGALSLEEGKTRTIALVGPTGVGKTTTIAKLAAHFALVEKRKVGLLTVDTYRIAAVDQLKTYSQIIDIPVQVAYSQNDVLPALAAFKGFDLVLIDTAGRSQKNVMQISELKTLVETTGCEAHLVLAASTKQKDMLDQVERFSSAGVTRLVFTKLDETATYGTMFTVALRSNIPLSYITTGQKVPEDIEAAEASRIAGMVLGGF